MNEKEHGQGVLVIHAFVFLGAVKNDVRRNMANAIICGLRCRMVESKHSILVHSAFISFFALQFRRDVEI